MQILSIPRAFVAALLLVATLDNCLSAQNTAFVTVPGLKDWALQESSGRVFALQDDGQSQSVVEYDRGNELRRFEVEAGPKSMLIKGDILAVACTSQSKLYLFDLKASQPTGTIVSHLSSPDVIFCSKLTDSVIYCLSRNTGSRTGAKLQRVDLEKAKVVQEAEAPTWDDLSMTPSGHRIIGHSISGGDLGRGTLLEFDAEYLRTSKIFSKSADGGWISMGPRGRFWMMGNKLFPANYEVEEPIRTFSGKICAIHPTLDLVASLDGEGSVLLQRFTDGQEIGREALDIESEVVVEDRQPGFASDDDAVPLQKILFDVKNNLIFVGTQSGGQWFDLDSHRSKLTKVQQLVLPTTQVVGFGKMLQLPVRMTDPSQSVDYRINLKEGPDGATINDGKITWTADISDVGKHLFRLELVARDGSIVDQDQYELEITMPSVKLDQPVAKWSLSPDGKTLVAIGEYHEEGYPPPALISVIDTQSERIVAQQKIPQGVFSISAGDEFIFLVPGARDSVYRIDRKLSQSKKIGFPEKNLFHVGVLSPKLLAVSDGELRTFEIDSLSPVEVTQFESLKRMQQNSRSFPIVNDNVSELFGRRIDKRTGSLLRLRATALPLLTFDEDSSRTLLSQGPNTRDRIWGRIPREPGKLVSNKGELDLSRGQRAIAGFSSDVPIAIQLVEETSYEARKVRLKFLQIQDGKILAEQVIHRLGVSDPRYAKAKILTNEDRVYVATSDKVHFINIPKEVIVSAASPTHFAEQQIQEIQVGKVEKVRLNIAGKSEDLEFALLQQYDGVIVDAKTGELEIDTATLWQRFITKLLSDMKGASLLSARKMAEVLDADPNRASYKEMFDRELPEGKYAMELPISAAVVSPDGFVDQTKFTIVVLAPRKRIDLATAELLAEKDSESGKAQLAVDAPIQIPEEVQNDTTSSGVPVRDANLDFSILNARLDGIESELRSWQVQVDTLNQQVSTLTMICVCLVATFLGSLALLLFDRFGRKKKQVVLARPVAKGSE